RVGYYEVFTPGVTPFKRGTALDAIRIAADGVPTLTVADPAPIHVPIVGIGHDDPSRTRFWGSVVLDFREGRRVPLPSVAPDARILSVSTAPAAEVRFERDSADNLHAVVDASPSSPVRLTFLMDAPKSYFNTVLPDVPTDVLASHVHPMPPALERAALGFARELGVQRGDPLPFALSALVEHFRSFGESERPPADTNDIFLDLARGGVGVCRHRAYAFVITAHALGIPARYVQNEAHAWAEVELGDGGFMRIDLGGSAAGLDAHGLADRPLYRPELPDPLPRPPAYEQAMRASGAERETQARSAATAATRPASSSPEPSARGERLRVEVERRIRQAYRGRALDLRGRVVASNG
ncbi:MAG: transglutaminase domain-containing protein, partial [Polyangiaceae bacterium]|nr:transglutaminase domain-containing protein [Polyangiaceae bacterium]